MRAFFPPVFLITLILTLTFPSQKLKHVLPTYQCQQSFLVQQELIVSPTYLFEALCPKRRVTGRSRRQRKIALERFDNVVEGRSD